MQKNTGRRFTLAGSTLLSLLDIYKQQCLKDRWCMPNTHTQTGNTHTHRAFLSSLGCVKNSPSAESPRGAGGARASWTWLPISQARHAHLASAAVHSCRAHCQKPNGFSGAQADTTATTFHKCGELTRRTAAVHSASPHPLSFHGLFPLNCIRKQVQNVRKKKQKNMLTVQKISFILYLGSLQIVFGRSLTCVLMLS